VTLGIRRRRRPAATRTLTSTGSTPPIPWCRALHFPDHKTSLPISLSRAFRRGGQWILRHGRATLSFNPGPDPAAADEAWLAPASPGLGQAVSGSRILSGGWEIPLRGPLNICVDRKWGRLKGVKWLRARAPNRRPGCVSVARLAMARGPSPFVLFGRFSLCLSQLGQQQRGPSTCGALSWRPGRNAIWSGAWRALPSWYRYPPMACWRVPGIWLLQRWWAAAYFEGNDPALVSEALRAWPEAQRLTWMLGGG